MVSKIHVSCVQYAVLHGDVSSYALEVAVWSPRHLRPDRNTPSDDSSRTQHADARLQKGRVFTRGVQSNLIL